jgi:hypothetical protein
MKTTLTLIASALAIQSYAGDLITEIANVESGNRAACIGDHGLARGAWQMHREAWDDTCARLRVNAPFTKATNYAIAKSVASAHLEWLNRQFIRATHRMPTPTDSYALWNLGVGGYHKRGWDITKCPAITQRASKRVSDHVTR